MMPREWRAQVQDQTDVLVAIFAILQVLLKHEADKAVSRR
jgi:hypothetical protein